MLPTVCENGQKRPDGINKKHVTVCTPKSKYGLFQPTKFWDIGIWHFLMCVVSSGIQ